MIPVNRKFSGKYESGWSWVAFSTGTGDTEYYITLQNLTAGSKALTGQVYDEYGNRLRSARSNSYADLIEAGQDGTARCMIFDSL